MKKILFVAFISGLALLTGCGSQENTTETEASSSSSTANAASQSSAEPENQSQSDPTQTTIQMTAGDTVITGVLDNSAASQAFIETLPQTISMNSYGDREYYASIDEITEPGEEIDDFTNGDICYYPPGPSFAIFYNQEESSNQSGLIKLGEVTSDLAAFNELDDTVEMTIEIAE